MKFMHLQWATLIMLISINQGLAKADPIQVNGDLVTKMNESKDLMPMQFENLGEGTIYSDPSPQQATGFLNNVFIPLYNSLFETSATNAGQYGYRLLEFTDNTNQQVYYILERDPNTNLNNFWGTYVYNPSPERGQLIIQSPHPAFDTFTDRQGAYIFRYTGARFLFMSGAHRANKADVGCSGSSSVADNPIGGHQPPAHFTTNANTGRFREADMAHNVNSIFQLLTEYIHDKSPFYFYFIQLHGFGQDIAPHVVLSNGRDEDNAVPANDRLSTLRTKISQNWNAKPNNGGALVIEVGHDDPDDNFNSFLAKVNTQGRYINGSDNPCNQSAMQNTGHFVHIEQGKKEINNNDNYFLRDAQNFEILAKAIKDTYFYESPIGNTPNVKATNSNGLIVLEWKVSKGGNTEIFEIQRSNERNTDFRTVGSVFSQRDSNGKQSYSWIDRDFNPDRNTDVFYRLKLVNINGEIEFSKTAKLKLKKAKPKRLKFLYNNRGTGKLVKVNIPIDIPARSTVLLSIVNPKTGFAIKEEMLVDEIQNFLRRQLPTYRSGIYIIKLEYQGTILTDKFLRL